MVAQAALFELRVARLEDSISHCKKAIESTSRFSAILHTQQLSAILFPNPPSFDQETLVVRQQETLLAPRERWEANVSEIQAPGWLSQSPRPILWIGGRQNKRGVSWVSSFTLDLAEAMEMERGVQLIHTLCNGGQADFSVGILGVFNRATVQLLKAYPEIVLIPKNLDKLSVQRFQGVGESPEAAYKVLVDVLKMIDTQCQQDRKELFWVIDRVDMVLVKENSQAKQRFLNALLQLSIEYRSLRILLTSQFSVDEMGVAVGGKNSLMEIWVDTSKPSAMHSRH